MDSEIEDKLTELQICIDQGHNYEMDKDSFDGEKVFLNCAVCGYCKEILVTKEQAKKIGKLFEDESSLEQELLKNEETD